MANQDGKGDGEGEDEEELYFGPDPIELEGEGAEVFEDVAIQGGVTTVEAAHDGERNFIITLVPANGEFDQLFVNEIGPYEGKTAELVDEGNYLVDIEADGAWEVVIRQPRIPTELADLAGEGEDEGEYDETDVEAAREEYIDAVPQELEGEGNTVVGPLGFDGTHIATSAHDGERNFIVRVLPQEGLFGELLVNEIGTYEGETTFRFSDSGWVAITADGEWTLQIE